MSRMHRALLWCVTALAVLSAIPPLGNLIMRMMLTQMLVQIPLLFGAAAMWGTRVRWLTQARWRAWNAQGASGLLASTFVLVFWMTPIALDHAASEWPWEVAKSISVTSGGFVAGISWRLGSPVTHIFYLGNMLWMSITVGMLYQESTERYCNAYLWDDQALTGRALVVASIGIALIWTSRVVGLRNPFHSAWTMHRTIR
jgi:hypothetical protein